MIDVKLMVTIVLPLMLVSVSYVLVRAHELSSPLRTDLQALTSAANSDDAATEFQAGKPAFGLGFYVLILIIVVSYAIIGFGGERAREAYFHSHDRALDRTLTPH